MLSAGTGTARTMARGLGKASSAAALWLIASRQQALSEALQQPYDEHQRRQRRPQRHGNKTPVRTADQHTAGQQDKTGIATCRDQKVWEWLPLVAIGSNRTVTPLVDFLIGLVRCHWLTF